MNSEAKIKKLESKLNELALIREKRERDVLRMYPNEKIYRFNGTLVSESSLNRILGRDKKS